MAAPTVYRHDDSEAPVANGLVGCLKRLLQACLVDGYGEKPAAGWTIEFESDDGHDAMFKSGNAASTGMLLQVTKETTGSTSKYQYNYFRGVEGATSINDAINPFTTGFHEFETSTSSNSTVPKRWMLIADDRSFYLFVYYYQDTVAAHSNNTNLAGMAFGDMATLDPDDSRYSSFVLGNHTSYGPYMAPLVISSLNGTGGPGQNAPRYSDGIDQAAYARLTIAHGTCPDQPGRYGMIWKTGDPIIFSRPYFPDYQSYSLRGWVPGLYHSPYCISGSDWVHDSEFTVNGKKFIPIIGKMGTSKPYIMFVSLDDWRA